MFTLSPDQYAPFFQKYIDYVPAFTSFEEAVQLNTNTVIQFANNIPADKENYAYDANKWTIKQVLQHINDTERVMTFRALVSGRGDATVELCKMDENLYANTTDVTDKSLADILAEFIAIRSSTMYLYRTINSQQLNFKTPTQAKYPISAKAIAYIIIGHATHHINVVKERYL
jgi:uncharacterized damage-inducible protein DinB